MDYPHADGDRDSQLYGDLSSYSTDPAADYEILRRVRETWELPAQEAFRKHLEEMWYARAVSQGKHEDVYMLLYEAGDYARSALAVLGE